MRIKNASAEFQELIVRRYKEEIRVLSQQLRAARERVCRVCEIVLTLSVAVT